MKRLFLLFAVVAALAPTAGAQSFKVPFVLDNPAAVEILINDAKVPDLVTGRNEFTVAPYTYITVSATEGYTLVSVVESDDTGYEYTCPQYGNTCEFTIFGDYGSTYTVTTAKAGDLRTATAHVWVDDPAQVTLLRGTAGEQIALEPGNNAVPFDPEGEKSFSVIATDPDRQLYKVTHNGTDITAPGTIRVDMADADELHIEARYPDTRQAVTVQVSGDYTDDFFIQGIYIDGEYLNPAEGAAFTVPTGAKVSFTADTQTWQVLDFTVNGSSQYFTSGHEFLILGPTDFRFEVQKYTTMRVSVEVDRPDGVTVYRGYHYNGQTVDIPAAGQPCAVDVRRGTPILTFVPAEGRYIAYAEVDDYIYSDEELKERAFLQIGSLTEGSAIKVRVGRYDRSSQAAVIVTGLGAVAPDLKVTRSVGETVELAEGFNSVLFDAWDNPFTVDCRGSHTPYVYLDDEPLAETYPGSMVYEVRFAPADVLKLFFDNEPALRSVTITVDPEVASNVTLTRDGIRTLEAGTAACLDGTVLKVTPRAASPETGVVLDGRQIQPASDGTFAVTVSADHTVLVTTAQKAGITGIETDNDGADAELYNLQGIRVDGSALPAGIYLRRDGTKVIR